MNDGTNCPEGYYDGHVRDAWFSKKDSEPEFLAAHFNVDLENGETVECAHVLSGKYSDMNCSIVTKTIGSEDWYNYGSDAELAQAAEGKAVRVSVKHKEKRTGGYYVNAYICSGGGGATARIETDDLRKRLAELKLDQNTPF
jgi:hypothetical protein